MVETQSDVNKTLTFEEIVEIKEQTMEPGFAGFAERIH